MGRLSISRFLRSVVLTMVLILIVVIIAACSGDGDSVAADPWGLAEVPQPTTQEEVNVLFLALPDELNGMEAHRDDSDHVGFVAYMGEDGEQALITWTEVAVDSPTTIEFLEVIMGREGFTTGSSSLSAGSSFVWLEGSASDPAPSIDLLWWGDPTDGWIFNIAADTTQSRDALLDVFVASSTS